MSLKMIGDLDLSFSDELLWIMDTCLCWWTMSIGIVSTRGDLAESACLVFFI